MSREDGTQPIARHLDALLQRLARNADDVVAATVRELIGRTLEGHTTLQLAATADGAERRARLLASGVCGTPGEFVPLVLDAAGRLYLNRYWRYERTVAESLLARASTVRADQPDERIAARLDELFPHPEEGDQKRAAAVAALRQLAVISGGPGTGKTTTVVRLLALLRELDPNCRIALAAPTGKAAARVGQSIFAAHDRLPAPANGAQLPAEAATLHRLLGYLPAANSYRYNADNNLPYDVVVVDEASMIGLAQMARLLEALPSGSRLVLLGDRDQLASVEPGSVFGDICAATEGYTQAFAQRLGRLGVAARARPSRSRLQDCVVTLRHSYRFGAGSDIGRLAAAVRAGDANAALGIIDGATSVDLVTGAGAVTASERLRARVVQALRPYFAACAEEAEFASRASAFDAFRLLCVFRRGAAGVSGLNRLAERTLADAGLIDPDRPWYRGRPVMVTRNDYTMNLFNGVVGYTDLDEEGRPYVAFETAAGWRRVPTPRLPEHETVYAMTVHKSQGSEFDSVALVLPERDDGVGRETVYTAITRARERLEIFGDPDVLAAAIGRREQRSSGLRDALTLAPPPTAPLQGELEL